MTRYIGSWQTPSIKLPEATDTSAPGVWKLDEQFMLQKWGRWPNGQEDWLTVKVDLSKAESNNIIHISYTDDSIETSYEYRKGYSGSFTTRVTNSWLVLSDFPSETDVITIQIKTPINEKLAIGGPGLIEVISFGDSNHFNKIRFVGGNPYPDKVSTNLVTVPNNIPQYITDCGMMFIGCINLTNGLSTWDTSNIVNMYAMFNMGNVYGPLSNFNADISEWNTSNVTNMSYMFHSSRAFNKNISNWDVSNVTDMSYMFSEASAFNQDLSSWCVSQFASPPPWFDYDAIAWVLPKPNWGAPCI